MAALADFMAIPTPSPAPTAVTVPGVADVHLAHPTFADLAVTHDDQAMMVAHKIASTVVDPAGNRLFTDAAHALAVLNGKVPQILALLRAIKDLFGW
jgi:hypothetical protein